MRIIASSLFSVLPQVQILPLVPDLLDNHGKDAKESNECSIYYMLIYFSIGLVRHK